MTEPPRKPQVFRVDDPDLVIETPAETVSDTSAPPPPRAPGAITLPTGADIERGIRWGSILIAAAVALAGLAASLWFTRFVSVALARNDWIGWVATGLFAVVALAAFVLLMREMVGLMRLARLGRLRKRAEAALADKSVKSVKEERAVVSALEALYAGRSDAKWSLAQLKAHRAGVHDAGELLALADRDLLAPIDLAARRLVLASAKRVMTVTAISPTMLISVGFVLIENVRLLRKLATLYGGRPGLMGALKLSRMVFTHLAATGSVALTDDLVGQFLGQDLLRRLSTRLGEGAFNAALTARIGAAAIEITRPLPYLAAPRVRVRDIVSEVLRNEPK